MPRQYRLSFDLPPSVNALYRHSPSGRVFMTEAGKSYKMVAGLSARLQIEAGEPLAGSIGVTLRFYGSKLDVDNGVKICLDAMNGIVWQDDRYIVQLHIYRLPDDGDPRVEVTAWEIEAHSLKLDDSNITGGIEP